MGAPTAGSAVHPTLRSFLDSGAGQTMVAAITALGMRDCLAPTWELRGGVLSICFLVGGGV